MELLFPRRIARLSYLGRTVLVILSLGLLASLQSSDSSSEADQFTGSAAIAVLCLAAYWLCFVILPRCRDLAMSGWFILLVLVPGVGVFFCGYLTWGRTKVRGDGFDAVSPVGTVPADAEKQLTKSGSRSESLRKLEALRDSGVITEGQFERMKAQRSL